MARYPEYEKCRLCPRECGVNRYERTGFCGCPAQIRAARAALHFWEEPCISGKGGSGAVFFSGCTLHCVFCQNAEISQNVERRQNAEDSQIIETHREPDERIANASGFGLEISTERLMEIFAELEAQGAENINLVTATQYLPQVAEALARTKKDRHIPVVYNCGGYEKVESLKRLEGLVDIWLPDFKYADPARAGRYSMAVDYPETALAAIREMVRQTGSAVFDAEGHMKRGVIVRHLVMPGGRKDSVEAVRLLAKYFSPEEIRVSILRQFTPTPGCAAYPELNRRVTSFEYESVIEEVIRLGFSDGYMQEKSSAKEEYIPPFDGEGVLRGSGRE